MSEESGTPYFQDIAEVWGELSAAHCSAIGEIRGLLTEMVLPFAQPADTTTTYDQPRGDIHLKIRHGACNTAVAILLFADQVQLHWPGGLITKPAWDRELADALKALLGGTNVIRTWGHTGKVFAVDTEIWLPGGLRRALPRFNAPGLRPAILRRLPWKARRTDATLSFARQPALAPPADRDRV